MDIIIIQIMKDLSKSLDEHRYNHSLGVMYTAASLAMKYEVSIEKSLMAGILHDCGKSKKLTQDNNIKFCKKYNIHMTEVEKTSPSLLHAKIGAFLAAKNYNITDEEVLSAILNHTTGKPCMSTLDKIVFIADFIEPQRNETAHMDEIRKIAFQDINKAVAYILNDTLRFLEHDKREIDDITKLAFDYYKKYL